MHVQSLGREDPLEEEMATHSSKKNKVIMNVLMVEAYILYIGLKKV